MKMVISRAISRQQTIFYSRVGRNITIHSTDNFLSLGYHILTNSEVDVQTFCVILSCNVHHTISCHYIMYNLPHMSICYQLSVLIFRDIFHFVPFPYIYIVPCQAHPALVKSGSNVRSVSFENFSRYLLLKSLTPCLVAARSPGWVCWRAHLAGM